MAASNLTPEQQRVLKTILRVGRRRGESYKEIKAAVETGLVESGLRNLNYGDADSAGWRQERAMYYKDPTNLKASVNRFYDETSKVEDQYGAAGRLAAAVQRPREDLRGKYGERAGEAAALIRAFPNAGRGGAPRRAGAQAPDRPASNGPAFTQKTTFDQAGYEQAKRTALVGGLIAKRRGTDSILFKSGLLTTTAPSMGDFTKTGMVPTPGRPEATDGRGPIGKTLVIGDSLQAGGTLAELKGLLGDKKVTGIAKGAMASTWGIDQLRNAFKAGKFQNVVFDMGTNDATAGELRESLRQLTKIAGGAKVYVATVNSPWDEGAKNRLLRTYARNHENVELVRWHKASKGGAILPDGIHGGYEKRAALIAQQIGYVPPKRGHTTPGSVPDSIRSMIEKADSIDSKKYPYVWGGGHARSGRPDGGIPGGPGGGVGLTGYDCSGAVAAVLGIDPRHSSQFEQWGKAGRARGGRGVTVYANNTHVLMEINGRFWGTSGANPRGGAGWIPRSKVPTSYLANFTARHL